jgi:hypothetical protein
MVEVDEDYFNVDEDYFNRANLHSRLRATHRTQPPIAGGAGQTIAIVGDLVSTCSCVISAQVPLLGAIVVARCGQW